MSGPLNKWGTDPSPPIGVSHAGSGRSGRGRAWPSRQEGSLAFQSPTDEWGDKELRVHWPGGTGPQRPEHACGPCHMQSERLIPDGGGKATTQGARPREAQGSPAPAQRPWAALPSLWAALPGLSPEELNCRPHKSEARPQKVHEDEHAFVNAQEIWHKGLKKICSEQGAWLLETSVQDGDNNKPKGQVNRI